MLDKDKIIKNTKKYFETAEPFMTERLTAFLGQDFMAAPASTNKDLNNAFEGGLIDHLLRTTKFAISFNAALPEKLRLPKEDLIKVCFLYQIGKAHLYTPCTSEWHIKNQGKMYDFRNEEVSMRVGERSAFYALSNGVFLTEIEYQAIVNHDKDDSDKQAKFHTSALGMLLKQANEWAIIEEKMLANESN
jgi:hypothetical protein